MIKENVRSNLHKQLFDLLVRRVDLEGELAYINGEIEECLAHLEKDEIEEIYASVDAYFSPAP